MATFPEFKEWFFTKAGQALLPADSEDSPIPQETPDASKSKEINGVEIGTIFKENNEPTEINYQKFFNSVLFSLNNSNRAKDSTKNKTSKGNIKGGHVTIATNQEAVAKDNGDEILETRTVRPSQLPETVEGTNTANNTYSFNDIDQIPNDCIQVTKNTAVTTHSSYKVNLKDSFVNWLRDVITVIYEYIGTLLVQEGEVTVTNGTGKVDIEKLDQTSTAAQQFKVNVRVPADNDATLSANSDDRIASQKAVKTYIDQIASQIDDKADAADLTQIQQDIVDLQNEKVNQTSFDLLAVQVANKVSLTGVETIADTKTFTSSPNIPNPTNGTHAVNKDFLTTTLTEYYKRTEVDALILTMQQQIDMLELNITNLNTQITSLIADSYTRTQIDTLLATKSDTTHNHNDLYHPRIANAVTGNHTLKYATNITVNNGILTAITN